MTERTRWPIVILVVAMLLTVAAGFSVTRLRPETSLDGMLDPHDPATAAMGRVMKRFPLAEELLVLVSLPDGDDDTAKLTDFAERLNRSLSADAKTFVRATRWRAGDSARAFVEKEMLPAGLLYLSDEQLAAAEQRLTPAGMKQQLARSAAMMATPGPAAGGIAKVIVQDPLRLHEFFVDAMKSAGLPASVSGGGDAFFTSDGRGLLVRIEGVKPPGDLAFSAALTDVVQRSAETLNTDKLRVKLSGAYAIAAHNAAAIKSDSIESCVTSTVALGLLFVVLYRRPIRQFTLAFVPVLMGLVWGFGLYACFKSTVTPLAAVIGGVLGGVGIDYPVHLMAHRRAGETPFGTTRRMFAPLLAAWATSAVGFAAVAWSPLLVLRDFALIGSLGLVGAWTATMTVLPAVLTLIKSPDGASSPPPLEGGGGGRGLAVLSDAAGERLAPSTAATPLPNPLPQGEREPEGVLATRGQPAIKLWPMISWRTDLTTRIGLAVVLFTVLIAVVMSRDIREDVDLTGLHPRPNPPLDALAEIDRRMGSGGGSFVLHLQAKDDAALLRLAWQARRALADCDSIKGVFGPASLLPDPDAAAKRIASPPDISRVVADFRAAVLDSDFGPHAFDAYVNFLPKLLKPTAAPSLADLRKYPDLEQTMLPRDDSWHGRPARDAANTGETPVPPVDVAQSDVPPAEATAAIFAKAEPKTPAEVAVMVTTIRDRLHGVDGVTLTGMAVLGNDTRAAVRRDAPRVGLTALVAIAGLLLMHLRSLRLALLTLLPTLFSFACVLIAMRLFDFGLNAVNLVMFPLLLGITVDYGIFATDVLRPSVTDRASERFLAATTALLACVATTFIGFGSLVTVAVPAVRSLGWLINVGLASCLLATLAVLWPAVLRIAAKRGRL